MEISLVHFLEYGEIKLNKMETYFEILPHVGSFFFLVIKWFDYWIKKLSTPAFRQHKLLIVAGIFIFKIIKNLLVIF